MGDTDSTGCYLNIDLENGGTQSEENGSKSQGSSGGSSKKLLSRVRSGFLGVDSHSPDGSKRIRDRSHSYDKLLDLDEVSLTNMEFKFGKVRNETINALDKEKSEKLNFVKPSKPPRPPKSPSLDAADVKMLKEISMLNLKRKRMEKIRTLKTIKKEKASSLSTSLFAIFVTVIFFYVIIFQGLRVHACDTYMHCLTNFPTLRTQTFLHESEELHDKRFYGTRVVSFVLQIYYSAFYRVLGSLAY